MFDREEAVLLRELGFDDSNPFSDDDFVRMEETVGDELVLRETGEDYRPTKRGQICERILDKLADL